MGGRRASLMPLAVLVALAVLAAIAVGAVLMRSSSNDDGARKSARARPTVPATGAPHEPHPAPTRGRSATEQAALAAARRFLKGYLPYSYGRGSASRIDAIAAPLAATLRRSPPRVPARIANDPSLRPRAVDLEVASANGDLGYDLDAAIDDGKRSYTITLAVRPDRDRWLVVAVS
jgi:hypothetical protein